MVGELMDSVFIILLLYTLISGLTDLLFNKIYNLISVLVFISVLVLKFYSGADLLNAFIAAVAGFAVFLPLYLFRIMSGGDIKMIFVLGFFTGYPEVFDMVLLSIVLSAVMALIILLFDGRIVILINRFRALFLTMFVRNVRTEFPTVRSSLKTPVAFALGVSAILNYLGIYKGIF
jgi:Flp pilus assembly protein protease CpaA